MKHTYTPITILTSLMLVALMLPTSANAALLDTDTSVTTDAEVRTRAVDLRTESNVEVRARLEAEKKERAAHREQVKEAREEHEDDKKEYKNERDAFLDIRAQWNSASDDEKVTLRIDVITRAKAFLDKSVDTLVSKLTRIKAWVSNHPRISDEVEAEVHTKIDAEVSAIETAVAGLDADGTTLADIQTMSARVRAKMSSYNQTVLDVVAKMKDARIESAQDKLLAISAKIDAQLDVYAEQGVAVESFKADLRELNAQVGASDTAEEIKASYTAMKSLVTELRAVVKASGSAEAAIE